MAVAGDYRLVIFWCLPKGLGRILGWCEPQGSREGRGPAFSSLEVRRAGCQLRRTFSGGREVPQVNVAWEAVGLAINRRGYYLILQFIWGPVCAQH
jgi:hypothetical protein